jgi:hypothetical protein
MSLPELQGKFSQIRFRLKTYFFLQGVSKLLLALTVFPFCLGLIDLNLHLPWEFRLGLASLYLLYLFSLFFTVFVYPLKKTIEDEDLARCIEKKFPELQDRLISSIQLKKRLEKDQEYPDSKLMVEQLLRETFERIKEIRFQQAFTIKPVLKFSAISLLILMSLASATFAYASYRQEIFKVMVQRLLLSPEEYPQKTHLALIRETYGIPLGGNLEVFLEEESLSAKLVVRTLVNDRLQMKESLSFHPEKKSHRFENIQESFFLHFEQQNLDTTLYHIKILSDFQSKKTSENENELLQIKLKPFQHTLFAPHGENLDLEFRTLGDIPNNAEIYFKYDLENSRWQSEILTEVGPGAYKYNKFRNIQDPFSFYLRGGDDFDGKPLYRVETKMAPKVDKIQITYQYPEYTQQKSVTKNGGKIIAPVGSWADLECTSNIPLQKAFLKFKKGNMLQDLELSAQGMLAKTQFFIHQEDSYSIHLLAQNGLSETKLIEYSIEAKEDQKPVVTSITPIADMECSLDASVPMKFLAKDDFGISAYMIRYKTGEEKTLKTLAFQEDYFSDAEYKHPALLGEKQLYARKTFEVSQVTYDSPKENLSRAIKEDDVLQFWAEVSDNRILTETKTQRVLAREQSNTSTRLQLNIVSKNTLERGLVELLLKTKKELMLIRMNQFAQSQETLDLIEFLKKNRLFESTELQKHDEILIHQKKVTRDCREALRDFDTVLESISINHLKGIDEYRIRQMQDLLLKSIDISQNATTQLQKTKKDGEVGRAENLETSKSLQLEALKTLDTLLDMMGKWEDFNEVVQDAREILEKQKQIREATKEKAHK